MCNVDHCLHTPSMRGMQLLCKYVRVVVMAVVVVVVVVVMIFQDPLVQWNLELLNGKGLLGKNSAHLQPKAPVVL